MYNETGALVEAFPTLPTVVGSLVIKYLLKEGVKEYVLQLLPVSSRLFGAVDRQELGALVRTSLVCTADWSMK